VYHLSVLKTEVYPTGVIRVIYAPTAAPGEAGYDDVRGLVGEYLPARAAPPRAGRWDPPWTGTSHR
jgi:hypothetical protein